MIQLQSNHIDIASNFAGTMMGVTNCVASICGFLAPYIVNLIVTESVMTFNNHDAILKY